MHLPLQIEMYDRFLQSDIAVLFCMLGRLEFYCGGEHDAVTRLSGMQELVEKLLHLAASLGGELRLQCEPRDLESWLVVSAWRSTLVSTASRDLHGAAALPRAAVACTG